MHLRLTEQELATLVEMACLATQCAMWNRLPEHDNDFERFADLEQKILSRAAESGLADLIAYDPVEKRLFLNEEMHGDLYAQKCITEMRNGVFWEELVFQMAERDIIEQIGSQKWNNLTDDERDELTKPSEEKYRNQFRKFGMNNLFLIAAPHGS